MHHCFLDYKTNSVRHARNFALHTSAGRWLVAKKKVKCRALSVTWFLSGTLAQPQYAIILHGALKPLVYAYSADIPSADVLRPCADTLTCVKTYLTTWFGFCLEEWRLDLATEYCDGSRVLSQPCFLYMEHSRNAEPTLETRRPREYISLWEIEAL